jgi:ABC-type dipeptide/oligopeptide/nickel transport system permease component
MVNYIFRRVLISIPLVLALVTVVFLLLRTLVPGDPALILGGETASVARLQEIRVEQGLDKPLVVQFGIFLLHLAQGNLGRSSITNQLVTERLWVALPVTLALTSSTFIYIMLLGLTIGVVTAYWQDTWIDNLLRVLSVVSASMPTFWLGLMLMLLFSVALGWLPVISDLSVRGLILPTITLGTGSAAGLGRLVRANMLDVLSSDYVRAARAKGAREVSVVLRHALSNTLIPVVTIAGFTIGGLLGGAVITESIFGLGGLGTLAINAIHTRDYSLIQGDVLFICVVYLAINLLADVSYGFVDPRIRLQ